MSIVIALVAGLIAGFVSGKRFPGSGASAEVRKLQSQVEQAKRYFPPISQEMRSIVGIVKEVQGNTITIEFSPANPFDESPRIRIVTIVSKTKITQNEQKDPATIEREAKEFQKVIQSQKSGAPQSVAFPTSFREIPAVFSDIRTEQQVSVTAAENIRDKESFTATQVSITGVNIPVTIPL